MLLPLLAGFVAAGKATEEDTQNDGGKKNKSKKAGDKSDTKMPAAVIPGQQEKDGKRNAKPGKGKKLKNTGGDVVASGDDVDGGGKRLSRELKDGHLSLINKHGRLAVDNKHTKERK